MDVNNKKYQQTPIGLIPSDWPLVELSTVAIILFSNVDKHILPNEIDVILCNYTDVYYNKYIFSVINFSKGSVSEEEFKKFQIKKGDVIITKDSEDRKDIAVPAYILENIPNLTCGYHLAIIRPQKNKLSGLFLSQILLSYNVNHYFQRLANGITRFGLSTDAVRKSLIPIPSINEQHLIAEILATWDSAIIKTKELIENIQQRNNGLAQQLLNGKMKVKGFEKTNWKYLAINRIAKEVSIKNIDDKELIVMSCTKYDGLVPSLEYFGRKIYSDDLTTYKVVKRGQFAYATNHIEEGSIGYQSKFDEALISPMYTVFQTDNTIDDTLFLRLLKSHQYIHQYQRRMEGSIDRRGGLRWDEFSKIKVPIMEIEEQKAIANILDTAQRELIQYQQKLQTLQQQKKGLMQQLLTGKIRVKI